MYTLLATIVIALSMLFGWLGAHTSLPPLENRPLLIAHRGVHQNFPPEGVQNDTCTATRIYPVQHESIENTIDSMRAAYAFGADMVELDVHPTTDGKLAVFHDWTLDCRTNGTGVTHEHSMEELRTLDVGYGYTADGGQTFPLRGKGVGAMPDMQEVFSNFTHKEQFGINFKDTFSRTPELLADLMASMPPERRKNVAIFGDNAQYEQLKKKIPEVRKIQPTSKEEAACIPEFLQMIMTGSVSEECREHGLAIPARYFSFVPGWPNVFLHQAHAAGVDVTITEVDTPEIFASLKDLPIAVIETNTIEVIGPLFTERYKDFPARL